MTESPPPEWLYMQSKGSGFSVVGTNEKWDGLQVEIDFFKFHAQRIGRAMGWGEPEKIVYHADGGTFGFALEEDGCNGVYAAGGVPIPDVLAELE